MPNNLYLRSYGANHTGLIGELLGRHAEPGDVFLLVGDLGSGKTRLTKGIAKGLDIKEEIRSPTFVLVTSHFGRMPLYHIDLYRLDHVAEVLDIGLEEYTGADGVSAIEWADRAIEAFEHDVLRIDFKYDGIRSRSITMNPNGQRYVNLLCKVKEGIDGTQGLTDLKKTLSWVEA